MATAWLDDRADRPRSVSSRGPAGRGEARGPGGRSDASPQHDQNAHEPVLPGPRAPQYQATGWNALGTQVHLMVADGGRLAETAAQCRRLLDRIERTCSRSRPDADLVRANRNAGRWVPVDPLLAGVVKAAIRVATATQGVVDPGLGGDLPVLHDASSDEPAPAGASAWEQIEVDPDGALMVPSGVQLDLGALGRAFAADLIAREVPPETRTSMVIRIGGDIAVGTLPGEKHCWRISVSEQPDDVRYSPAVTVVLAEGALATSSTLARRWQPAGNQSKYHRDPRTGLPVDPSWRSASVCAATCVDASAASVTAIVLGDQAPAWLWQRSLAARLVTPTGRVLRIAGWPDS